MKQYLISDKTITLRVKKSPVIVRGILFFTSFISFGLSIMGLVVGIITRKGFHIGYFIGLFLFGLVGFYLLRISLWNTYGKEIIRVTKSGIEYEANYGWFKDGKNIEPSQLSFSINQVGYQEDNIGTLLIGDEKEKEKIKSVVKMPINQLNDLITEIRTIVNG